MSSTPAVRREVAVSPPAPADGIAQDILDGLNAIGFDRPVEYLLNNDPKRVRRAVDLVLSKPCDALRNPAGLIRYLVSSPGDIPEPVKLPRKRGMTLSRGLKKRDWSVFKS